MPKSAIMSWHFAFCYHECFPETVTTYRSYGILCRFESLPVHLAIALPHILPSPCRPPCVIHRTFLFPEVFYVGSLYTLDIYFDSHSAVLEPWAPSFTSSIYEPAVPFHTRFLSCHYSHHHHQLRSQPERPRDWRP